VVECDITQPEQIEAMCDSAIDRFGALDILVANAGVVAEGVPAPERTPPDAFAMGIDVNVSGTFNTVTAAARRMLAAGSGSIIINASVAGISISRPFRLGVSAAKSRPPWVASARRTSWPDRCCCWHRMPAATSRARSSPSTAAGPPPPAPAAIRLR
jgi:NAD(P)-dependent dehydrogenase (short-subunit alcohol dehydrogenase family)